MRLLRMFVALCLMGEAAASNVDPGLVGVWTMEVPNDQGTARWVWDVHADGTYSFHAEGPGNVPAHGGSFAGFAGHYLLNSTTLSWTDAGTYQLQGDSMLASGKLGKGTWTRMRAEDAAPPTDPISLRAGLAQIPSGARVTAGTPLFNSAICNRLLATPLPADKLPQGFKAQAPRQVKTSNGQLACDADFPIVGPDGRQHVLDFLVYKDASDALFLMSSGPTLDKFEAKAEFHPTTDATCKSFVSQDAQLISCWSEGNVPYNGLLEISSPVMIYVVSGAPQSELIPSFGVPAQILAAAGDYFTNQIVDLAFADSQFLAARK